MKLAIHKNRGSFSERWINYCEREKIEYRIVNCYASDIVEQMQECDALLWNWNNTDYKAMKFARQLIYSLEIIGKKVFPDSRTCWHYDDKIGQKYLLEAIEVPFVNTYIFYDKREAIEWVRNATFPKVFKLSGGGGATNVKLIKDAGQAIRYIRRAFGRGFSAIDRVSRVKDTFNFWRKDKSIKLFIQMLKAIARTFIKAEFENMQGYEKGYVYFQDFIPNNSFDIRVITIGNKAFAIKRMTRDNDFRASGSGKIIYDRNQIDVRCIEVAFNTSKRIESQCTAYDFVFDLQGEPLIIEISYAFLMTAYDACEGYWDDNLKWHNKKINPQDWMIEQVINEL